VAFAIEAALLAPMPLLAVALAAAKLASAGSPAAAALTAAVASASSASSKPVTSDAVPVALPTAFVEPALVSLQLSSAHCETALLELLPVAAELQRFIHR